MKVPWNTSSPWHFKIDFAWREVFSSSGVSNLPQQQQQQQNGTQVKTFKQQTTAKVFEKKFKTFFKRYKKKWVTPKKNDMFQPKTKPSASPWRELLHHLLQLEGFAGRRPHSPRWWRQNRWRNDRWGREALGWMGFPWVERRGSRKANLFQGDFLVRFLGRVFWFQKNTRH